MRRKKQAGSYVRIGGRWYIRYYESRRVNGTVERHRASYCLGDVTTRGKNPPWEIQKAAEAKMAEVNEKRNDAPAVATLTVSDFFQDTYVPWIKRHRRPSTAAAISYQWANHIKPVVGKTPLKDVNTATAQRWLDQMAEPRWKRREATDPRCQRLEQQQLLAKNTLSRFKSTLSGAFKYALQKEFIPETTNPMRNTTVPPETIAPAKTHATDLDELMTLLAILPEPANTTIAIAGFAGLRKGEIEGLNWEDWHDGELWVCRSIWNGRENKPKTEKSEAPVPVIPQLEKRLDMHRLRCGEPDSGPVFGNAAGGRASLHNMLLRTILPVLKRCKHCGKQAGKAHAGETHAYLRDDSIPDWHGWHAFRRGVATSLYSLGIGDLLIQRILRHSNVSTTQACYIKTSPKDVTDAMEKLAQKLEEKTLVHEQSDSNRTAKPASATKVEPVN